MQFRKYILHFQFVLLCLLKNALNRANSGLYGGAVVSTVTAHQED